MKAQIFLGIALSLISSIGFCAVSELNFKNVNDFEYVHCVPSQTPSEALVVHYIVDLRDEGQLKLFVTSASSAAKASELKKLTLLDSNLSSDVKAENIDVQWTSAQNSIDFQLVIHSNDGQLMLGNVINKAQTVPVRCVDVVLEK